MRDLDTALHAATTEGLDKRVMEIACERTGNQSGAISSWDAKEKGLAVDFHVVEGVVVSLPGSMLRRRRDGRANGIALTCFDSDEPYVCNDTSKDPNYARYFLDVGSILAVPIPWQSRAIGVLSVSSPKKNAFDDDSVKALSEIAS